MKEFLYDWCGLNTNLFLFFNGLHSHWTDAFMMAVTAIADYRNMPIYYGLLLLWVFLLNGKTFPNNKMNSSVLNWYTTLSAMAIGYAVEMGAVTGLKILFDFPRPLKVLGESAVTVLGDPHLLHSFPSGHSAFAAFFVATLWPVMNRIDRSATAAFVVLAMVSRMVVGAHFPMDVLTGAVVGVVVALGIRRFAKVPVLELAKPIKKGMEWLVDKCFGKKQEPVA